MKKVKLMIFTYLALAMIGLVAMWYHNLQYFAQAETINFTPYLKTLLVNSATTAMTIDVYMAALVFTIWVLIESRRLGIKWPIVYVLLCFGIGLAFALPLYLAQREWVQYQLDKTDLINELFDYRGKEEAINIDLIKDQPFKKQQ